MAFRVKIYFMIDPDLVPALQRRAHGGAHRVRRRRRPAAAQDPVRGKPADPPRRESISAVPFFERAGRGVRLSTSGRKRPWSRCNRLFDEAEAAFGLLAELSRESRSPRCASPPATTSAKGCSCRSFAGSSGMPRFRFEITTTHSLDAPRAVERAARSTSPWSPPRDVRGDSSERRLFHPAVFLGGPATDGEQRASRTTAHRADLAARRGKPGATATRRLSRRQAFPPRVDHRRAERVAPLVVCVGGLGVGLAPALALAEAPQARIQTEPAQIPPLPVKLVWRANYRRTPQVERFVQRVVAAGHEAAQRVRAFARTAAKR